MLCNARTNRNTREIGRENAASYTDNFNLNEKPTIRNAALRTPSIAFLRIDDARKEGLLARNSYQGLSPRGHLFQVSGHGLQVANGVAPMPYSERAAVKWRELIAKKRDSGGDSGRLWSFIRQLIHS